MRNIPILILVSCLSILLGCKGKSSSTTNSTASSPPAATTPTPAAAAHPLPSITLEEMQKLYNECDYIDFIYYNMDFSMSVNTPTNVQRVVTFVDKTQPSANATCPAMGRIIYQKDGETLLEADMHYSQDCQHFIFYKDNKKVYANNMTQQGIAYFQQMFSQVKVVPK